MSSLPAPRGVLDPLAWRRLPLLPGAATATLDRAMAGLGVAGTALMERAGQAVAATIVEAFAPQPVTVLCGPGKNGGDGYVVAASLRDRGWPVTVLALGAPPPPASDAGQALQEWAGPVGAAVGGPIRGLVVDALFGVGLDRALAGEAAAVVAGLAAAQVVSVDLPSGIAADSGAVLGVAVRADLTVTFGTAKPGHLLLPGRRHTGRLVLADLGFPPALLAAQPAPTWPNDPARFAHLLPRPDVEAHKHDRGHALVVGGPGHQSGAARLAAMAALRVGAGLATLLVPPEALATYAGHLTAVMVQPLPTAFALRRRLAAVRLGAALIGPAAGTTERTLRLAMTLLEASLPLVLDADALTVLGPRLKAGRTRLHADVVITPHDGEFTRLVDLQGDRLSRARAAAATLGAVVLLKGADTVVAHPDGRAVIQPEAPASLATAGSGDVLAGIVTGLLAGGMPAFEAAAAATWLHARAAAGQGQGLIAEDLVPALRAALAELG